MKIEAPSENKIVVELSCDDLDTLDITFEEMDYSNIETRRVIWTLLDEARRVLGRDIDPSGKMLIEAVPKSHGGCVLFFTVLTEKIQDNSSQKLIMKKDMDPLTYEFENVDNLLDASNHMSGAFMEGIKSELYHNKGKYRLLVYCDEESDGLRDLLIEFSTLRDFNPLTVAYTREHWELLFESSAIERMAQAV